MYPAILGVARAEISIDDTKCGGSGRMWGEIRWDMDEASSNPRLTNLIACSSALPIIITIRQQKASIK